jgi:hypothetical protein
MRVALVGPEIEENLSLRYLMSSLSHSGFTSHLIPFNYADEASEVARRVLSLNPDLLGYSLVAQRRFADYRTLTDLLRRGGYGGHITAGGHFASLRAPEILRDVSGVDSILHHDGERRIADLARSIDSGGDLPESLDGITWRDRDGEIRHRRPEKVADVDSLCFPTRRRPDRTLGFAKAPIVSSRGCAGNCSFCSIRAWHRQVPKGRLRFRSPANVAEEMVALHRELGVRVFIFHDDDFIHPNPRNALPRCREILDRAEQGMGKPLAFVIKCRPDDVQRDLFSYLKSKGLVRAYVGIETHSDAGIRVLNRRVTKAENERALAILDELGIYSCFNLLLFHPDTTVGELQENLRFLELQVNHPFDVARTELYAQSALEQRMIQDGRAVGDYRGYDYIISDPEAEGIFRLFANVLWERHFGGNSILQRAQDLGYRLSLLSRFYPTMVSTDFELRVNSLIRDVNTDTIGYIHRLGRVVAGGLLTSDAKAIREFQDSMCGEIAKRLREQSIRWGALSFEMECRARIGRLRLPVSTVSRWPNLLGRLAASAPFAALMLGSLSCGNGNDVVCDPPPPPEARFSLDVEPTLNETCAVTGCHDSGTASESLVLEEGSSYGNLVDVSSRQVPSLKRVEPGRSDLSYLVQKLEGTQADVGGTGERMPRGGEPDPEFIDKVKRWILGGAEND